MPSSDDSQLFDSKRQIRSSRKGTANTKDERYLFCKMNKINTQCEVLTHFYHYRPQISNIRPNKNFVCFTIIEKQNKPEDAA